MIFELLPLLRGYAEDVYQVQSKVLNPGEKETWRAEFPGWVTQIEAFVSHRGFVVTDALLKTPITFTYYDLMRRGLTALTPEIWLTIYDDPSTRYAFMYAPRPYYRAIRRDDYLQLQAPLVDPATGLGVALPSTINLFRVRYIYLIDQPEFMKSLSEVLGISDLSSKIADLLLKVDLLNENMISVAVAVGAMPTPVPPVVPPARRPEVPAPVEAPEIFDPSLLRRRRREQASSEEGGDY